MVQSYLSVDETLNMVLPKIKVKPSVFNLKTEESVGFVSARDFFAPEDIPPYDVSHMDGYAINIHKDKNYRIVGKVFLGRKPDIKLKPGEAFAVSTGSYVPDGTYAVARIEDCIVKDNLLFLKKDLIEGQFIYKKGSDIEKGRLILRKGEKIRLQHLPSLFSFSFEKVPVYKKPRVSLIMTGSELSVSRKKGKIRETHSSMVSSFLAYNCCKPYFYGIVEDDINKIREAIEKNVEENDMLIISGGTSMGQRDYSVKAIESLNPEVIVHGIKMDRGRVTGCAVLKGKPVIIMPGPIQASMNSLIVIGFPIIRKISGLNEDLFEVDATLNTSWNARKGFEEFKKVLYVDLFHDGCLIAEPIIGPTESISVLLRSKGVVVVSENISQIKKGEKVKVKLVPGFSFS